MRKAFIAVFTAATAVAFVACGSDDKKGTGSSGQGEEDGGDGEGGGSNGGGSNGGKNAGGKAGPTGINDSGTACVDPEQVIDVAGCIGKAEGTTKCKEQSVAQAPGTKVDDPSCGAGCTCTNCVQEMLDCGNDALGYCPTILKCAQEHNCTGVACYAMTTCQVEIDNAPEGGLTSISVALATAVSDCITPIGCPAACP